MEITADTHKMEDKKPNAAWVRIQKENTKRKKVMYKRLGIYLLTNLYTFII